MSQRFRIFWTAVRFVIVFNLGTRFFSMILNVLQIFQRPEFLNEPTVCRTQATSIIQGNKVVCNFYRSAFSLIIKKRALTPPSLNLKAEINCIYVDHPDGVANLLDSPWLCKEAS